MHIHTMTSTTMMMKNTAATATTTYSQMSVEEEVFGEDGGPLVWSVVIGVGDGEVVEGGERMGGEEGDEGVGEGEGEGEGEEVAWTTVVVVGREEDGVVRIIGVEVTGMS